MKRHMLAVTMVLALSLGFTSAALASSGAGAINLTFPIGARYNALGEAGTALSQDVTSQWWNVGGLGFMPSNPQGYQKEVHFMQSSLAQGLADDIGLYWLGYAMPLGKVGALGINLNYLDMGDQQATNEDGSLSETFHSYMFSVGATYGVRLSRTLGFGLGVKYFRDELAPETVLQDDYTGDGSASSFGVDLGLLWKVPRIRSNIGLSVVNLGPDISHQDADIQSDPMPRKATLGWAYSLYSNPQSGLLFVADYQVPLYKWETNDYGFGLDFDYVEWGGGLEWNYLRSLFLRFGYKSAEYGDITDTTWGFGVDLNEWVNKGITFEFAQVPQATGLPRVTRLSLAYRF